MDNELDAYAENWDIDPAVDKYASLAFSQLNKSVNLDGLSVLDFGCGTGALTQLLSAKVKNIVAIDPSSEMIKYLDKKSLNNVTTIANFLTEALIKQDEKFDDKFDLIIASSVCAFLPAYEETVILLKSLLKEQGKLIQWDWLAQDESAAMGLTKTRVKQAFESAQFKDVVITTSFIMDSPKGSQAVLMAFGSNG